MERLGLSDAQLVSLAADLKKIVKKIEDIREHYGISCISVNASTFCRTDVSIHQDIQREDVDSSLTHLIFDKNAIKIDDSIYYDSDNKRIKED